jgi:4-hydroxy-tetrahydrodipicolinate synthase
VKDSTGDFKAISKLISEAPEGFEVYSGDDWATFGYVCLGAVGVVSVAAHLVGDQMKRMVDLIETGDVPAARKLHEDLSPLFNALFVTSNPIPVKAALDMLGRPAGPPRLPLVPATEEERARIRTALEAAGLL